MEDLLTPPSQEDIAKAKEEFLKNYETDIEFLKKKLDYDRIITELDELQFRRIRAHQSIAQMVAPAPEQPEHDPKIRSLRKES